MSDVIAPIVADTDEPSSGARNGAAPVRKTQSAGTSSAGSKPSLSSRLDNLKISTIRQHYYPEGGWGWVICACAFLINMVTTGLLLSYGVLYGEVIKEFGEEFEFEAMWLGSFALSTGLFFSPLIVAFCRRKSTRLTAVFGGLTAALGCLFASFASQLHQAFLGYGLVMALGLGMARSTSSLMVGQYFKRKRDKVEAVVCCGTGVGVAVFSCGFLNALKLLGWRLGLHAITGTAVAPFFLGICYRSASLYHPQRRAILHLKNQRKKIRDKSGVSDRPPFFDWAPLRSGPILVGMLSAALCSFGLYAPFFHFVPMIIKEGYQDHSILLLQTYMGAAYVVGCLLFGLLLVRRTPDCIVGRLYLCQAAMVGLGVSMLTVSAVDSYHGYVLFVWMYGVPCGGLHYTLKTLIFEKIRAKSFSRAWSYVEWAQSIPVLVGLPVTGYINKSQGPKTGFFFSAACAFAGAGALCLNHMTTRSLRRRGRGHGSCSTCTSHAPSELFRSTQESGQTDSTDPHQKCQKTISFSDTVDVADDNPQPPADGYWGEDMMGHEVEDVDQHFNSHHDLDEDVVVCYEDHDHDGRTMAATSRPQMYGCGHFVDDCYFGEQATNFQMPPKRQMTIIEEVTSTV